MHLSMHCSVFFSMDSKKDCLFNCKSWLPWLLQCSDQAVSSVIPQVNQDEEFQCFGMKKRNLLPSLTVVCQLPHVLTKRFYRVKNWPTLCLIGILCQILNITSELLWVIINNELRQQLGLTRVILRRIRVTHCQLSYLGISNTVANMVFEILKILCYNKKRESAASTLPLLAIFFFHLPQILIILNPVHISNCGQKWIIERQVVSNDPRNWLSSDDCQNMMTNQPIHIIH